MAQPSKLSPEVRERICALIRAGTTVEIAATAAGISEATFHAWIARGESARAADRLYRDFRRDVDQARGEAEATLVARIAKAAAGGSWQAAAWLLERRMPERWAKISERMELAPPEDKKDGLDELRDRRAARRAGAAAPEDLSRPAGGGVGDRGDGA